MAQLAKAFFEASLSLAFRLASKSPRPVCLCEFSSEVFINPFVLQDLPAGSLTSSKLMSPDLEDDIERLNNPSCLGPLASLTSLRRLVISMPYSYPAHCLPVGYIAAISSLLHLTYLELDGAETDCLSQLPSNLLELDLFLKAAAAEGGVQRGHILDLKHLSKLTSLTIIQPLDTASCFPPSLRRISTVACLGTLQALTRLRSLSQLVLGTMREIPTVSTFALLTGLTSVTDLQLSCYSRANIHNSVAVWSQLSLVPTRFGPKPALHAIGMP